MKHDNGRYRFKSNEDYEIARACMMKLSKEVLVDFAISGNNAFRFNDDVKDYVRSIKVSVLLEEQEVLLEKMDENCKQGENLRGIKDHMAWLLNMQEYQEISKKIDDNNAQIDKLQGRTK
jgi:hypothetical protein